MAFYICTPKSAAEYHYGLNSRKEGDKPIILADSPAEARRVAKDGLLAAGASVDTPLQLRAATPVTGVLVESVGEHTWATMQVILDVPMAIESEE